MPISFLIICLFLLLIFPCTFCWSASTSFIAAPPSPAAEYSPEERGNGLIEICGKCRIRVGNRTAELFSFIDGPNKRFLFVSPQTKRLQMLEKVEAVAAGHKNGTFGMSNKLKVCRIVRWGRYPSCNLQKVRTIQKAELYPAKYGRARTNIAQMGFVPKVPGLWHDSNEGTHKWWWFFALRLNQSHCRLAKLPTGAPHIILDLGVRLLENADLLHACPLAKENGHGFGCAEPHIFLLDKSKRLQDDVPMELGFSYEMVPEGGEFRVNPAEKEYSEKNKPIRIMLSQKLAGRQTFIEFAPYCDYSSSFESIQPFNGQQFLPAARQMNSMSVLAELQQSLLAIKSNFKTARWALEKLKKEIETY